MGEFTKLQWVDLEGNLHTEEKVFVHNSFGEIDICFDLREIYQDILTYNLATWFFNRQQG